MFFTLGVALILYLIIHYMSHRGGNDTEPPNNGNGFIVNIKQFLIDYISLPFEEYYYNKYLRYLKIEDAKEAELDQELNDTEHHDAENEVDVDDTEHHDAENEVDVDDITELDVPINVNKYRENNATTQNLDTINVGDLIIFRIDDTKEPMVKEGNPKARRNISTYDKIPIEPHEWVYVNDTPEPQIYYVEYIHSTIPNAKGYHSKFGCIPGKNVNINIVPILNNDIEVFQKKIMTGSSIIEYGNDIFWYINMNKLEICQYEDGFPLMKLKYIDIVGSIQLNYTDSDSDNTSPSPSDNALNNQYEEPFENDYTTQTHVDCSSLYGPDYNFNDGDW